MGIRILASPTEPKGYIEKLDAIVSSLCEQHGADYMIYSQHGVWGGQRKEVPHDFVSSMIDGRMARETGLLATLDYGEIICEGKFEFFSNGMLVTDPKFPSKYNRKQIRGMLLDIRFSRGIPSVTYTEDEDDTITYIKSLAEYMAGEKHLGLFRRPKVKGGWGIPTERELELWILQSFPGIGPTLANNILEHFGRLPLIWDATYEQLLRVPDIGVARAKRLWSALGGGIYDK